MNPYKERFAAETGLRTLADAMRGADVFVGVSAKDQLTPDMLRSMNVEPDRARDGQPGSGDHLGAGVRDARRT